MPVAGQLDLGQTFSCAIVTGGQVRCWGYGGEGELGYPGVTTVGATNTPAALGPVDLGAGFTAKAIASGDAHTCAIRNDGSVVCWGYGADGRLGYGNTHNVGDTETPGAAGPVNLGAGRRAVAITAGGAHTCAILDNGQVACWGYGFNGELGYGSTASLGDNPADTPNLEGTVDLGTGRFAVALSAGSTHTCAILDNGTLLCWGYGGNGRLGYGDTLDVGQTNTPAMKGPVSLGTGRTARAIAAGGQHTCAILDDGTVRCWGFGFSGELGYGNQSNAGDMTSDTPALLPPVNLGGQAALAITTGGADTCAILDDGSVRCWGYGAAGRLGYGGTANVGDNPTDIPALVGPVNLGAGRTAIAISAGEQHTCARLDDGSLRCWGYGGNGRLGYCSETSIGDAPTDTPDTAGPVNLLPGDGGQLCAVPAPSPGPAPPASASPPSISGHTVAGQTLTEAHGTWSPAPSAYANQWERCDSVGENCGTIAGATGQTYALGKLDVGSTIRVLETATGDGGSSTATSRATAVITAAPVNDPDAARKRGFQSCLAKNGARARHIRALTHRGSARQRARARRRLARLLESGDRRCTERYGHTPGRVTHLRAIALTSTRIELDFIVVGNSGNQPPAAQTYLIKQSPTPIGSARDFKRAFALCHGTCHFIVVSGGDTHTGGGGGADAAGCAAGPATSMLRPAARPAARPATSAAGELEIGMCASLVITHLKPHATYYYSIAARDNITTRPGPRSRTVHARTR
jgi:alpha-tubulin suppressor-like RCC1 family protein